MSDREKASYNILNYVSDNKYSFDQKGYNDIDGLVMTQIANMQLEKCGINIQSGNTKTVAKIFDKLKETLTFETLSFENQTLIEEMSSSPRYKDVILSNYVSDPVTNGISGFESIGADSSTEQFGAVTLTYIQNGQTINYMAFRATNDSTDGWNEDFLMVSSQKTQAQADSATYMNLIGPTLEGDLVGGGHSKGGNDFEYGYLFCDEEVRKRITAGYLYDSPGLQSEIIEANPNYEAFQRTIDGNFICPQDSVIGQVLHENDNAKFVHSVESGMNEHDPYTWEIDTKTSSFIPDTQTEFSKYVNDMLDNAVEDMSPEERQALYAFVSYILYNSGGEALGGVGALFTQDWKDENGNLRADKLKEVLSVIAGDWGNMTPDQQKAFVNSVSSVVVAAILTKINYVIADVGTWIVNEIDKFKVTISTAIANLGRWIDGKIQIVKGILENIYESFVSIIQKFAAWFMHNSSGYKYASANPLIKVDTYKLMSYASRLQSVNRRIVNLDQRLNSLYWKVGFSDLWSLSQAEALTGYSWNINRCIAYLADTANDFENAENEINNSL